MVASILIFLSRKFPSMFFFCHGYLLGGIGLYLVSKTILTTGVHQQNIYCCNYKYIYLQDRQFLLHLEFNPGLVYIRPFGRNIIIHLFITVICLYYCVINLVFFIKP